MGAICCCFGISSSNDHGNSNNTLCFRLNSYVQDIRNKCASKFGVSPPNNHSAPSSDSMVQHNNSSTVSTQPLSNSVDPRYSRVPHEVATTRQEPQNKGSGHSRVEPEPRRDDADIVQVIAKSLPQEAELNDPSSGKKSKECDSDSFFSAKFDFVYNNFSDSDDEDVCPTCLEEYTLDNPKIVAKCSHHFHLSCIYDWKERSNLCPVCRKLMTFNEML